MKKFLAIVFAVALALSLCACTPGLGDSSGSSNADGSSAAETKNYEYTVMSFNIKVYNSSDKGYLNWSYRSNEIVKLLDTRLPNIICMQEVTKKQFDDLTTLLNGKYTVVWHKRNDAYNPEGVAVLFTDRFTLLKDTYFWLSETPTVKSKGWDAAYERICTNVTLLDNGNGKKIDVFSVHLDNKSQPARLNGAKLISKMALECGNPAIIAGDFNATKKKDCYKAVEENFQDCYFATPESLRDKEVPTFNNFGNTADAKTPIDFIFSSKIFVPFKSLIITEKTPDGAYYSDHYPVLSKLRLPV